MNVDRLLAEVKGFGKDSNVYKAFMEAFESLQSELQYLYTASERENLHDSKFLSKIDDIVWGFRENEKNVL